MSDISAKRSVRVCGIMFRRDPEHEAVTLMAWKRREHPAWSQHAVSYRIATQSPESEAA